MMQEEVWVAGASEKVTAYFLSAWVTFLRYGFKLARVARNSKVTGGVDTEKSCSKVALHVGAEGEEIRIVLNKGYNIGILAPTRCGSNRYIATQASGIVA
jgi:hypothetical protein